MGNCSPKSTGVASFSGRKNQLHDGQWCKVSCKLAKKKKSWPVPDRCKT